MPWRDSREGGYVLPGGLKIKIKIYKNKHKEICAWEDGYALEGFEGGGICVACWITSFKWKTFFISCFEWKGSWSCRLRAAPFDIWGLLGILDSENSAVLKYSTSDNVDPTSRKLLQLAGSLLVFVFAMVSLLLCVLCEVLALAGSLFAEIWSVFPV